MGKMKSVQVFGNDGGIGRIGNAWGPLSPRLGFPVPWSFIKKTPF